MSMLLPIWMHNAGIMTAQQISLLPSARMLHDLLMQIFFFRFKSCIAAWSIKHTPSFQQETNGDIFNCTIVRQANAFFISN